MTTQSQLILVCEKLLGWRYKESSDKKHGDFSWYSPQGFEMQGEPPPLTLDLMHECWLKLTPEQKKECLWHLWNIVTNELATAPKSEFLSWGTGAVINLEDSTKEQRLAALVETIGGMK